MTALTSDKNTRALNDSHIMDEETVLDSLPKEPKMDVEGTVSDGENDRGGKQARFDEDDSDDDSTVSSSSSAPPSTIGKRGFRGKGRRKKSLAFRCVNFLKVKSDKKDLSGGLHPGPALNKFRVNFNCITAINNSFKIH